MSEAPFLSDHPFFGSTCDKLEKELSKKACVTVQNAIDSAICASLKHSVREGIRQAITVSTTDAMRGTPSAVENDVGAALEEIVGNAVCSTLRQATTDYVYPALNDAISASLQNAMRWEQEMPFHVTPEALNVSLEEVTGNAACAALKQVIADNVCNALGKAIAESVAFVVRAHTGKAPAPSREMLHIGTPTIDAGRHQHGGDVNRYTPQPDPIDRLCAVVRQRMTEEVCSLLQQHAASTLCTMLKTAIREGIRQHTRWCEDDEGTKRSSRRIVTGSVLSHKTGIMVIAVIAVVALAAVAAAPNASVHFGSTPATTLSLYVQTPHTSSGGASLNGMLATRDGVRVGGQIVELQRQSEGSWTTLGCATTQSDGSFVFDLVHRNASATFERASSVKTDALPTTGPVLVIGDAVNSHAASATGCSTAVLLYGTPLSSSDTTAMQAGEERSSFTAVLHFQQTANSSASIAAPSNGSEHVNLTAVPSLITVQAREVFIINGSLTQKGEPIADAPINIERSPDNATWSTLGSTVTDQSGQYTLSYYETEAGTAYYRTSYPSTEDTSGVVVVVALGTQSPAAVIDVTSGPPYLVGTPIAVDGSQSAKNASITYSWSVTGPSNSNADISPSDAPTATFTPDQPGSYTVHLTVMNSKRLQGTADHTFAVSARVSPSPTPRTASPMALPSPSGVTPSSHPVIVVPNDQTPSPDGHLYRVVFPGSAQNAASTSEAILVNDTV